MEGKSKQELLETINSLKNQLDEETKYRIELEDSLQNMMHQSRGLQLLLDEEKVYRERLKADVQKYKNKIEEMRNQKEQR